MSEDQADDLVVTLSCVDRPGIVHAVAGFLMEHRLNIVESRQFEDRSSGRFYMRVQCAPVDLDTGPALVRAAFVEVAERFGMTWRMTRVADRPKVLIMVSKTAHCLNDLLFRAHSGELPIEVVGVVSNHPDLGRYADQFGVPFRQIPVTSAIRQEAESELLGVVREVGADLVVLARYMQILSADLCKELEGRAINIHHSMLPSFKGARPYHQAHDRGVKLIGATAHYVTPDLDEGPIIEQEVTRVDHSMSAAEVTRLGKDNECRALARAVRYHAENRVLLDGHRTVVLA